MSGFFSRLTPVGRVILAAAVVGGLWGAKYLAFDKGMVFKRTTAKSQEVGTIDLPTAPANAQQSITILPIPTSDPVAVPGPEVRGLIWAWNSQMGLLYATGGKTPTSGSLMAKNKVNLHLERQDAVDQMQAALIKFAKEYAKDPNTREGDQFVADRKSVV